MTQANALQQHSILGQVYCSPAGQWGYRVFMNGVQVACNAGYDDEIETAEACCAVFPDIDFPVRVVEAVGFSFLPLPGSLGGFELSQVFAFGFFGLGGNLAALGFSLITRIISLLFVVIGIIYLAYFEIRLTIKKISEALPEWAEKIKNFFIKIQKQ